MALYLNRVPSTEGSLMENININTISVDSDIAIIIDCIKQLWVEEIANPNCTIKLARILWETSPKRIKLYIDNIRYGLLNFRNVVQMGSTYPYTHSKLVDSMNFDRVNCKKFKRAIECVSQLFDNLYRNVIVLKEKEKLIASPECLLCYYGLLLPFDMK